MRAADWDRIWTWAFRRARAQGKTPNEAITEANQHMARNGFGTRPGEQETPK